MCVMLCRSFFVCLIVLCRSGQWTCSCFSSGPPDDPHPPPGGFLGPPQAPDKIFSEKIPRRGVGVKIPAPVGAGILTTTPPPAYFFVQDLVWRDFSFVTELHQNWFAGLIFRAN